MYGCCSPLAISRSTESHQQALEKDLHALYSALHDVREQEEALYKHYDSFAPSLKTDSQADCAFSEHEKMEQFEPAEAF